MVIAYHAYSKTMRFFSDGKKYIIYNSFYLLEDDSLLCKLYMYNNIVELCDRSIESHFEFLNVQCLM